MPFKSPRQRSLVFMLAAKNVPWARKFIEDAGEKPPPVTGSPPSNPHEAKPSMTEHAPRGSSENISPKGKLSKVEPKVLKRGRTAH